MGGTESGDERTMYLGKQSVDDKIEETAKELIAHEDSKE